MRLSSPTGPTVSLHRSTSFLRGCNPIEESKLEFGSLRGIYCASSMGELVQDQDWKARQPRSYSDISSSYPSAHSNRDSASSQSAALPVNSRSPSREQGSEVKRDELSPLQRKRKLSWSRSGAEEGASREEFGNSSREQRSGDVMRPMSSGARTNRERLPGIAHLDEQMQRPWSVENARRTAGLRGDNGEDSLRRLSSHSFSQGSRSWRFSLPDAASPAGRNDLLPPTPAHSIRRASSPTRSHMEHLQPSYDSRYAERPSVSPGGGSRRTPPNEDRLGSYSQRPSDERDYPPRLPSRDDRRHQAAFAAYDSRDEPFSYSQDQRPENTSDYSRYRYPAQQPHHRDAEMTHLQSSYSHQGGNEQSYGHRMMDRDSPSYYDEASGAGQPQQQRMEGGSHSYPSPGINTSPSVPRRRGKLPKVVTDLLKAWLLDHSSHPYPTEDEKRRLCSVTGLSISQVSNWFINARRRILVPQGSGNFALGQPSTSGGSPPPLHHLAPPPHNHPHHPASQHHQQGYHQATAFQDEGKNHLYRPPTAPSRSHSSDSLPHLSRRSFDEPR